MDIKHSPWPFLQVFESMVHLFKIKISDTDQIEATRNIFFNNWMKLLDQINKKAELSLLLKKVS